MTGTTNTAEAIRHCNHAFRFCLSGDEDAPFFDAIEVNQPFYVSPIMMIPEHRHTKELQVHALAE